jgi:hypothetical protein
MKLAKLLFLASWVLLMVLSAGILLASVGSLQVAYSGAQDNLTAEVTFDQLSSVGGEEAIRAFRGRRVTAASWAVAYALLSMLVVVIPYRKGARWAWWALLISLGLSQFASLARAVLIGTSVGTGTSGIILAFLLLGLLAGTHRIFGSTPPPAEG